jgi:ABC-type phosphate transport system substrate-binding protein
MRNFLKNILFLVAMSPFVASAVTVIVHPSNNANLDKNSIKKIFLGKAKSFPGGGQAVAIDLSGGDARGEFISKVVGKSESQLKAYWSKLIFTGKGQAPKAVSSDAEVIQLVSQNPNLIGYVSDAAVNDTVKIIAKF